MHLFIGEISHSTHLCLIEIDYLINQLCVVLPQKLLEWLMALLGAQSDLDIGQSAHNWLVLRLIYSLERAEDLQDV